MSSQTLLLFPSVQAAHQWALDHPGLNVIDQFERGWVLEEFEKLDWYYRKAEEDQPLFLISFAMDIHHARAWLEESRSSQLEARFVLMSEKNFSLDFEWWSGGWREEISWRLIQGQRVVMLGFSEKEQKRWSEFCALELVRMIWINHENWRFLQERGKRDDFLALADQGPVTRALALIWGEGPTFSRPLMLSSKTDFDARTISRYRAWWAIYRFRSRWF